MGDSLTIEVARTSAAGRALAATADDAGAAGSAFRAAADAVPGAVGIGASVASSVRAVGESFGAACAEMLSSALGLGGLIEDAAAALAATEDAAVRRFGQLAAI